MVNNKYTWDLDAILEGETLDKLHTKWLNKQKEILALYPTFLDNLVNFKKWLKLGKEYRILSNRIHNYVHNNYNDDMINQNWLSWSQKLHVEGNQFSVQLSGLTNKIVKNEPKIREYLKDKAIKKYERDFELTFRTKPHILNDEQQEISSKLSIVTSGFEDIFSTLTNTDIKFPDAKNAKNKSVKLNTFADVVLNLKSNDRVLRKSTWINFNETYSKYENTLTQTLYYNYLLFNTSAKIHKFKNYVEATAFDDEINVDLILSLYKNAEIFKDSYVKYRSIANSLLKKQLGLTKLEPWDKSVEISKKKLTFTVEQTKQIVLKALKPLGKDYIDNVEKAFNERWISWLPKQNKREGAYSIGGTKGLAKYYILMNFDKTINSVFTIAHELGHSMNSLYIHRKQDVYDDVSIFYAEIASIVNEVLLSQYLLDVYKDNKDLCKSILDEMISNFFNTVSRQIIFSSTEYELNELLNANKPFTKEIVKQTYRNMTQKYTGVDKEMISKLDKAPYKFAESTILRIPHFYAGNFYVYKYAIGQIAAIIIGTKIYQGDKEAIDKYYQFLSSGSSLSPIDTIKLLGIDLYDNKTFETAKTYLNDWINKLNKFVKK